eukprot:1158910-Pelagomonas_calceolata.AAC.7
MACAANYAWVNRAAMTFLTRQYTGCFCVCGHNLMGACHQRQRVCVMAQCCQGLWLDVLTDA